MLVWHALSSAIYLKFGKLNFLMFSIKAKSLSPLIKALPFFAFPFPFLINTTKLRIPIRELQLSGQFTLFFGGKHHIFGTLLQVLGIIKFLKESA